MLIGEYQYTIDVKGRLFIPVKFREDLGESFVVTKGLDDSLFVYSEEQWRQLLEKINALPMSQRDIRRFFLAGATQVELDKQGRALLPQNLREHAHLEKDVVIIGVSERVEIWDKQRWENALNTLTSEAVAEKMEELGF